MKTCCVILFALLGIFRSSAVDYSYKNSGPVDFKLMASAQIMDNTVVSDKIKGTVETVVSKSTVSNWFLDSGDLLKLLENSYNTNFPSGSQLSVTLLNSNLLVYVSDATGTNRVASIPILLIDASVTVHTGSQTIIANTGASETSGNTVDNLTQTVVLYYNDSYLAPADGKHTVFSIFCLLTAKSSLNLANDQIKYSLKFKGRGDGVVRGQTVVLQGGGSAKIAGTRFLL
jgi:hypothetical protein